MGSINVKDLNSKPTSLPHREIVTVNGRLLRGDSNNDPVWVEPRRLVFFQNNSTTDVMFDEFSSITVTRNEPNYIISSSNKDLTNAKTHVDVSLNSSSVESFQGKSIQNGTDIVLEFSGGLVTTFSCKIEYWGD